MAKNDILFCSSKTHLYALDLGANEEFQNFKEAAIGRTLIELGPNPIKGACKYSNDYNLWILYDTAKSYDDAQGHSVYGIWERRT